MAASPLLSRGRARSACWDDSWLLGKAASCWPQRGSGIRHRVCSGAEKRRHGFYHARMLSMQLLLQEVRLAWRER